jgi:hypothetical protein
VAPLLSRLPDNIYQGLALTLSPVLGDPMKMVLGLMQSWLPGQQGELKEVGGVLGSILIKIPELSQKHKLMLKR